MVRLRQSNIDWGGAEVKTAVSINPRRFKFIDNVKLSRLSYVWRLSYNR
ncbi:MAG: hypothetical protein ACI945_002392 [Pseudohongiellaceae bacterium]|jgi:hypothetical protein